VEEGKGQGGLATSRQYGNALLYEYKYQEEEIVAWSERLKTPVRYYYEIHSV